MKKAVMKAAFRTGCILALAAGLGAPAWCGSTVISTSGQVQLVGLPTSLVTGANENDSDAVVFLEQKDITLRSDLTLDAYLAGVYDTLDKLSPTVVAAGTVVSSTYLHADPVISTGAQFVGSITFATDVLGVIARTSSLVTTDGILGLPSIAYGDADSLRGMEGRGDSFVLMDDHRTVSFSFNTSIYTDELRVITAATSQQSLTANQSAAPEPGTLALLPFGLGAALWLRSRQRKTRS